MSAEDNRAHSPLLHIVDGSAQEGRVRRAERLRRDFGGYAIVAGGLDEECRCAGLGLHSIGSAPWRSIARTVQRTREGLAAQGMRPPIPLAWSVEAAMMLARNCSRLILVAEGPPPYDADRERLRVIEVIAPNQTVARAWSLAGAASTRIVEPCALTSGAPASIQDDGPIGVLLFPGPTRRDDAVALFHRLGLVFLAGANVVALLNENHPEFPLVDDYARRVGIDKALHPIKQVDLRPRARIAFVGGVECVNTDERILDFVAQRITVVAFGPKQIQESAVPGSGIACVFDGDTNSGCKLLMDFATNPDRLSSSQVAAQQYAERRDARAWCTTMSVATSGGG